MATLVSLESIESNTDETGSTDTIRTKERCATQAKCIDDTHRTFSLYAGVDSFVKHTFTQPTAKAKGLFQNLYFETSFMTLSDDVISFLKLLNNNQVEYLIIGGAAVNIHGFSRATGDMDIWFNPTQENFDRLLKAIESFGFEIPRELRKLGYVRYRGLIRLPFEKFHIEFLADIGKKFRFEELYTRCKNTAIIEELNINVIGYDDLIDIKLSVHRAKDLEDIRNLERARNITEPTTEPNFFIRMFKRLSNIFS